MHTLPNAPDGTLPLQAIRGAIRNPADVHNPRTGLIGLENTHNRCGGAALGPDYLAEVRAIADDVGVPVHLDGARLFNAAVAHGVPAHELAR